MNLPQVIKTAPVKTPTLLYPALIVAAISVTLFSLIGIAGMTGHLPTATAAGDEAPKAELHRMAAPCNECGVIESVRAVEVKGGGSGVGAVVGGIAGALLGNTLGAGNGRTAMTLVGGGAGAYAGNEVEKNSNRHVIWQTRVKLDNGTVRTFSTRSQPEFATGSRVKVVEGQLVAATV